MASSITNRLRNSDDPDDDPGKDPDDNPEEDPEDLKIKELLSSSNPDKRTEGIERLDKQKREQAFRWLRCWSNTFHWHLHGQEIDETWQAMLLTIWRKIESKRFAQEGGRLEPFIRKITFFRARDVLRHRDRGDGDIDWDSIIDARDEGPQESRRRKFLELILRRYAQLSPTEKLVIRHLLRLYHKHQKFSLDALVASINKTRSESEELSKEAVKSAKARAFRKLRGEE